MLDCDLYLLDALLHIVRDDRRSLLHLGDDDVLSFDHDGHLGEVDGGVTLSTSEFGTNPRDERETYILKELRELDERLLDPRELRSAGLNLAEGTSSRLAAITRSLQTLNKSVFVA